MTVPCPVGVNVAKQLAVVELTVVRLHGEPVNDPAAVPVLLKDAVPPGVVAPAPPVSLTKAVQVVD